MFGIKSVKEPWRGVMRHDKDVKISGRRRENGEDEKERKKRKPPACRMKHMYSSDLSISRPKDASIDNEGVEEGDDLEDWKLAVTRDRRRVVIDEEGR